MSSLEGLAVHLGGIKQGRKAIIWVTEAFGEPLDEVRDLYEAANRANVAIYPLRDLLGSILWLGSYAGDRFYYRGKIYVLKPGGRVEESNRNSSASQPQMPKAN